MKVSAAVASVAAIVILSTAIARSQEDGDDGAAQIAAVVEGGIRARSVLHSARIGVSVVDIATGREIYARDGDGQFNAASNTKIVTAAAALALLGPDYAFRTSVYIDERKRDGTVDGDIYLVGRGDPSLDTEALRRIADDLRAAGVTRVRGGLVLDDSYFDDVTMPPHFDEQPDEQASFRAPAAALSLNFNSVKVIVRPGASSGAPAVMTIDPPNDYVQITGSVTTVGRGRTRIHVKTTEAKGVLQLEILGRINIDASPRTVRQRIADPHAYVGSAFRTILGRQGIRLGKTTVRRGAPPVDATEIVSYQSRPLAVLVRGMGKYSNNFVAEMVFKTIGAELESDAGTPATWANAQTAVKSYVTDLGVSDAFRIDNGSGLFDSNRLTPRQITRVLRAGYLDFRWGPDFVASLSLSGADGTLGARMTDSPADRQVRAKTGTLAEVSALSGYVAVDGTGPLAFSILVNDIPRMRGSLRDARSLQDEIAAALVVYLRSRASR